MTRTIPTGDGREAVINADLGSVRLSLWANRGSSGIDLTPEQAMEIAGELIYAARRARKQRG